MGRGFCERKACAVHDTQTLTVGIRRRARCKGRGQWKGRNAKCWCEAVRMTQRPSLRVRGNRRKSEKAAPAKGVEKMTGERRSKRKAKGRKGRDRPSRRVRENRRFVGNERMRSACWCEAVLETHRPSRRVRGPRLPKGLRK